MPSHHITTGSSQNYCKNSCISKTGRRLKVELNYLSPTVSVMTTKWPHLHATKQCVLKTVVMCTDAIGSATPPHQFFLRKILVVFMRSC